VRRIRLTWVLTPLLIVQSISAQNAPTPLSFARPPSLSDTYIAAPAIAASDLASVRDAICFASRGRPKDATDAQQRISDPSARKLVEWAILRSGNNGADYARCRPSSWPIPAG
jgi:hypothetical protein